MRWVRFAPPVVVLAAVTLCCKSYSSSATLEHKKHFTVADEIGISLFMADSGRSNVCFSPNGAYIAVLSQRGRLDLNRPEYSLRFYRRSDVERFLTEEETAVAPSPAWDLHLSTDTEGQIIQHWRWLPDSTGVAFLQREHGMRRLVIADPRSRSIHEITPANEDVDSFDIRDRSHFVYTATDPTEIRALVQSERKERHAPAIVGTGRRLGQLILPEDPVVVRHSLPRSRLWAMSAGKTFQVKRGGAPIVPESDLALSPDGQSVVTTLPVADVPEEWETLYPPPSASSPVHVHAGHESAKEYVRIDLRIGFVQSLTAAPISSDAGWWAGGNPAWSSDGQRIVLPGTFIKSDANGPSRPCVAVVDVEAGSRSCVEDLMPPPSVALKEVSRTVSSVQFAREAKTHVLVTTTMSDGSTQTTEYQRMQDGKWQSIRQNQGSPDFRYRNLEITVKQSIDQPPLLLATRNERSRVIWDPNPQLKNIALGEAIVYRWKDKQGRKFKGGLFKPPDFKAGRRYPLVIQTHGYDGFDESFFYPAGNDMPTAFAARALAGAGILVLQVVENCTFLTVDEGPCAVSAYESGVNSLVAEGVVDPEKIGIIGFSRSCFYVMESLTTSSQHFRAASITSGLMFDYWQYELSPDRSEGDQVIGSPPFGEGLQEWFKRSPGFNLDKVNAPLMVVGEGPSVLLVMWAAYSGLHQRHKPVDLIMLNSDEHTLTNPAVRMVSQGGSVDWFRFWLQGYEDPDPGKADQYKRWRELKKLQADHEKTSANP
jgi:dipeptidyl aminopeptidase/acylaminoacyl peptidase